VPRAAAPVPAAPPVARLLGPVELARPGEMIFAARNGSVPALAGNGGETLDKARRDGRRARDLGGVGEEHLARAEELGEIVRREADAALRQIETEIEPHRAAEPGIGPALRRPSAFDQAAEHDTVAIGEPRFKRPRMRTRTLCRGGRRRTRSASAAANNST